MNDTQTVCPRIYTRCPSCHNDTLTINDGHLLCTWIDCKDPTLIHRLSDLARAEAAHEKATGKPGEIKALASATGSATPVEWWLKRAAELAQQMKVGGVQTLTLNRLPTGKYEFEITPEG